jgi:uncharacterized damage-inducible protein DinB
MKKHILDYAHYNLWANTAMVNLFRQQSDAVLEQQIVSSFSSIRETLLHLWSVEVVWMSRLKGISPTEFPAKTFKGTNTELFDHLLTTSQQLVDMVAGAPDSFFDTPLEFTLLTVAGSQRQLPGDIYQHLFNHQTSHRGQLITMGRQAGIQEFPRTDYIIWVRENRPV